MMDRSPDLCLAKIHAPDSVLNNIRRQSDVLMLQDEQSTNDQISAAQALALRTEIELRGLPAQFITGGLSRAQVVHRLRSVIGLSQRLRGRTRESMKQRMERSGVTLETPWGACDQALKDDFLGVADSFRWQRSRVEPTSLMTLREVMDLWGSEYRDKGQIKATRISNSLPVEDTFTGDGGLESHTSESNHTWGGDASSYTISSGEVATENRANYFARLDPSDTETDVRAEITGDMGGSTSTNTRLGVGCRFDTGDPDTGATGYITRLIATGSGVSHDCLRVDAGLSDIATIINGSSGLSASATHKIEVIAVSDDIEIELNDSSEGSTTDTTYDGSNTNLIMYQRETDSVATLFEASAESSGLTITPSGIASAEAFGSASLALGGVNIVPSAIASAEAFGSHVILSGVTLTPTGISSAEAFGDATINVGGVAILPNGIVSGEAFGSHVVATGIVLIPGGIASAEAFGTATVIVGGVTLLPPGIVSGELISGDLIVLGGDSQIAADTILQLWRFRRR